MSARSFLLIGLLSMLVAVVLGAFGAHGLRAVVTPERLQTWQTATEYHFIHALGLIALAVWMEGKSSSRLVQLCGLLLIAGVLLFSGSLYLLVLADTAMLGIITPFGGLCFIAAWACWFIAAWKSRPPMQN